MARPIDLFIIGAQKAGTTSFHKYLLQHPKVDSHYTQEFTYYTNEELYENGFEKYFNSVFKGESGPNQYILAKCAGMMYNRQALLRLKQDNPNCKLIIILRNPVKRSISAYKYAYNTGREKEVDFKKVFDLSGKRFVNDQILNKETDYLGRSLYYDSLEFIFNNFSMDNVQVFIYEKVIKDYENYLSQSISMIATEGNFKFDLTNQYNLTKGIRSKYLARLFRPGRRYKIYKLIPHWLKKDVRELLNKLNSKPGSIEIKNLNEKELFNYFEDDIRKTENLLGQDLSIWKY